MRLFDASCRRSFNLAEVVIGRHMLVDIERWLNEVSALQSNVLKACDRIVTRP